MSDLTKFGYKNISNQDSIAHGKPFVPDSQSAQDFTPGGFVKLNSKGDWGMPGQTLQHIKSIDEFMKSAENVGKNIQKERIPTKYVGW